MPCVYVLYSSKNQRFYTGSTRENNPIKRLQAHNSGKTRSTKSGRPWIVKYVEYLPTYTEAWEREFFLKSGQGRKFLKGKLGEVA